MDAKSFFMLVREMRTVRKEYFRLRSHEALTKSVELERKVDTEIHRVEDILGLDSLKKCRI